MTVAQWSTLRVPAKADLERYSHHTSTTGYCMRTQLRVIFSYHAWFHRSRATTALPSMEAVKLFDSPFAAAPLEPSITPSHPCLGTDIHSNPRFVVEAGGLEEKVKNRPSRHECSDRLVGYKGYFCRRGSSKTIERRKRKKKSAVAALHAFVFQGLIPGHHSICLLGKGL